MARGKKKKMDFRLQPQSLEDCEAVFSEEKAIKDEAPLVEEAPVEKVANDMSEHPKFAKFKR